MEIGQNKSFYLFTKKVEPETFENIRMLKNPFGAFKKSVGRVKDIPHW